MIASTVQVSQRWIVMRRKVSFSADSLEKAIMGAKFGLCHPYIKWPNFGKLQRPGEAEVKLIALEETDTPESFIAECDRNGDSPLTAAELAELVTVCDGNLNDLAVFAFGESCDVAGFKGYPYTQCRRSLPQDDQREPRPDKTMDIWYFAKEWPDQAVAAVKAGLGGHASSTRKGDEPRKVQLPAVLHIDTPEDLEKAREVENLWFLPKS